MAYTKTQWVNDSTPAINATNLNKIEQGIYDAHQTNASLNTNKADKTSLGLTNRRVDALEKVNKGQTYDIDTDTADCYTADIPSGAVADSVLMVGGKSVVMNQLVQNGNFTSTSNWAVTSKLSFAVSSNVATVTFTDVTGSIYNTRMYNSTTLQPCTNHKFYMRADIKGDKATSGNQFYFNITDGNDATIGSDFSIGTSYSTVERISTVTFADARSMRGIRFNPSGLSVGDKVYVKNVMVIDLTQMFGAGNEPSTTAEFKAMFPADYYAYNTGEIKSASVDKAIFADDGNATTETVNIPSAIQQLDGYGWSAGSVYNYVDYAEKKYHKRVARVDLGSLTWEYSGNGYFVTYDVDSVASSNENNNGLCHKFSFVTSETLWNNRGIGEGKYYICCGRAGGGKCRALYGTLTDVASFKTAMNGVYLYYELAEEVVTDISSLLTDGFLEAISVEAGGTVSFHNSNGDNYHIPINNTNEFIVKLSEVNG